MPLQLVRDMVWQTLGFLHMVSSIAELKLNEQRPSIFHPMRYGLELYCKADHSKVSLLFKMFHSAAVRECGLPTFPPAFASPPSISTGFPSVPLIQPFFFFFFFFGRSARMFLRVCFSFRQLFSPTTGAFGRPWHAIGGRAGSRFNSTAAVCVANEWSGDP